MIIIGNHCRSQIQEMAGPTLRQPLLPIHSYQRLNKLLQLLRVESWENNSRSAFEHAAAIAVRAEDPELGIMAAVNFHAFEAFGCIMED